MLALGILAIIAAVKYTVGKNNYGYKGLGDIAVFIFFGWVSTAGVYYLATHTLVLSVFLPASAIGMLSMGVLNVNNIRDRENDKEYGKNTLVVKMGEHKAKIYHLFLISGAWCLLFLYSLLHNKGVTSWIYLLVLPMFVFHLIAVYRSSGRKLDVQLRNLSLMTLLLTVLFGISLII
jgi:1,4-dihydroxy-2-naphthoate octaprenyltransferase